MKILSKITYGFFILVLLFGASVFFMPSVPFVGSVEMKIVKSGSMEPGIKTGSVVVIREGGPYTTGDVITFKSHGSNIPTTHRIVGTEVEDGETRFISKGDANEERDTNLVSPSAVLGKVILSVPYLGFIIDFARQPIGFGLLIGLPAFLIILDEIEKIWKATRNRRRGDRGENDSTPSQTESGIVPLVIPPLHTYYKRVPIHDIRPIRRVVQTATLPTFAYERHAHTMSGLTRSALTVLIIGSFAFVSTFFIEGTFSYAKDIETALNNLFRANAVDFTATPDSQSFSILGGVLEDSDNALIFSIEKHGESTDLMFNVSTEVQSGDQLLCDALLVDSDDPQLDPTSITAFTANPIELPASWTLALAVDGGVVYPSTSECVIDFVFKAWDKTKEEAMGAYSDEERVTFTITAFPEIPEAFRMSLTDLSAFLAGGEVGTSTGKVNGEAGEGDLGQETGTSTEETPEPETEQGGGGGSSTEEQPVVEVPEEVPVEEAPIEEPTPETPEEVGGDTTEPEAETEEDKVNAESGEGDLGQETSEEAPETENTSTEAPTE